MEVKDNIITNSQLVSKQTTGTAPIVVASTTVVSNLNADLLDGQHGAYYEPAFGKNTAFNKSFGDSPSTVTEGNDPRLSDARQPISHNHDLRTLINYGDVLPVFRGGKNIDELGSYILAKEDDGWTGGARPSSANHAFGVISLQLHTGSYTGQIGLSSLDNKMYYRSRNGGAISSWRSLSFEDHTIQSHAGVLADSQLSGAYTGLTNLTGSGSVDFAKFLGLATDTVSTPSFSWTGDLATGFYRPTGSQIGVTLAGVQRALFSTAGLALSGNLGIGGATPNNNLAGTASIAIGDGDTGFRQNGDGVLETYANNTLVTTQTSSAIIHTRNVTAPVFIGALTGNASSATLAPNYLPLTGGNLSGNLNALGTRLITNFVLDTHPESSTTVIPFIHNDIAYLRLRGGTATDNFGNANNNLFDGSPSYISFNNTDWATSQPDGYVLEAVFHKTFSYSNKIGVSFGASSWLSKYVKIEVFDVSTNAYRTVLETSTNNSQIVQVSANGPAPSYAISKMRMTFNDFNTYSGSGFRLAQIWLLNFSSQGAKETLLGRDGGTLYGNLTAPTFIGGLTGNANTATKLANINTNFSGTYPLTVNVNGEIYSNAAITYNGSSGELKAPTFIGNLSGNLFGSVPFIYSTTLGTAYNQTVQIREKGLNGPQGQSMAAAPRLAFHWSGQVASSIAMEANGRIAIMNNPGTGYENLIARDIISSGGIFSGPGTGLTGTATGLTVGNANYANSAGSATDSTKLPLTGGTLTGEVQTAKRKIFSLNLGSQVDTWYLLATVNTGNSGINIRGTINNHVTRNGVQQFDLSIYGRKDNAGSQIEVSGHYSVGAAGVGILVVKSGVGTTYEQYDVYLKARAYTQCEAILTIQGFTTSIVLYDISNSTTTRPTGTAVEFDNTSDAKGFYSVEASSQSRIRTENNFTSGITANNWASGDDARINNGQSAFTSLGNYLPLAGGLMSGSIARSVPESGYQIGNYNLSNNASNTNPIYVIGSNFRPTDTVLNNMYGIGYTNTQSAFLNSTDLGVTPSGWGLYVAAAGKARVFLDADTGHIYGKGNVYAQQGIFRSNLTLGASNISNGQRSELNMYSYDNGAQQVGTLATNYSDGVRSIHLFGNANNQQIKIDASANVNGKIILMPGSSGNVGIGTTTPSEKLEVFSTLATGSWLKINPSAPGRESGIKIRQSTTYGADIYFNDAVGTDKGIKLDYVNVDTRYNALFITPSTNPSVGLGTYTPTEKLEVVGNVKATNFYGNLVGSAETLSNVTIQNINTITNGTLGSQVQDAFDFNLATNSGVYEVIWGGFIANSPQSWTAGSNHYGLLVCDGRFNSRFIQTISESSGPASFYRVQNGSVWGAWTSVITSANIGAQSVTYATTAGTASNGLNTNQHYNVIAGGGNGLRFWNGSDSFKVSMGNGSLFQYGTVTDYSIKMQMDQGSTGRGFTWGRQDITPIASLNSTSGNFQTAGTINALGGFIGAGTGLTGAASALSIGGSARLINIGSTSTISDLNIVTTDNAVRFDTFTTPAVNKPAGGNNANGVITFTTNHGSQYGKQIAFVDNDDLYIRRLTGGTYASWLSVMHSGNIGSQSVNYANSAGNATSSTNAVNANNADHISTFNNRLDSATYPVTWTNGNPNSPLYSCNAVRIQSSNGQLTANSFRINGGNAQQYMMADGSVNAAVPFGNTIQAYTATLSAFNYNQSGTVSTGFDMSALEVLEIRAVLVCKVANNGYAIGDTASILNGQYPIDSGRTAGQGITIQGINNSGLITFTVGEQFTLGVKRTLSGQTNGYYVASNAQWNLKFIITFITPQNFA